MASLLVAFIVITGIILLVDFVEKSRNLTSNVKVGFFDMLKLIFLNAPRLVEQTIPFVVLFGTMGALYNLNRKSELIVLRASGLSAWRFLKPIVILVGILGVVWALAFNPLAAKAGDQYEVLVDQVTQGDTAPTPNDKNIWLRDDGLRSQMVIHAKSADFRSHTLHDVVLYYFDLNEDMRPVFTTRYDAKTVELKSGFWLLHDVIINESGKAPQRVPTLSKQTNTTLETFRADTRTQATPPFWQLREEIQSAKQAGFNPNGLILKYNKLLALPLSLIAMAIIAACASLNITREGGTLQLLIIGGALGFAVFFADSIISAFGANGTLPPVFAAWAVPVLVLMLGIAYLAKTEDG